MKILLLTDSANIHTRKWALYLSQQNIDIEILSLSGMRIGDLPLHTFASKTYSTRKSNVKYNRIAVFKQILPQVRKRIEKINPDILHAHYASSYGLFGAISGFHPFVVSIWGSDITDFPYQNFINRLMIKYVLNKADKICTSSQYLYRETQKFTSKQPSLIYFGTDFELFKPSNINPYPIDFSNNNKPYIFGTIKALYPHYGINYLIEAASLINKKISNWELWIGGEGDSKIELQNLAKKLHINDKVKFLGKIPHDRVPIIMNEMHVFIVPSLREAFGVAAVEASGCCLPVIVTKVGGLPEIIINGETGFCVEPQDPQAIADKIELLYTNPVTRTEMGYKGRQFVQNKFSWQENAPEILSLYEELLRGKTQS